MAARLGWLLVPDASKQDRGRIGQLDRTGLQEGGAKFGCILAGGCDHDALSPEGQIGSACIPEVTPRSDHTCMTARYFDRT